MRILSLFDGMSCGMISFKELGIKVDQYVAYEVDKYAIKTSLHNFPEIEQKGNVFGADFSQYKDFDWLIGGSPCTYWSIAQCKNRETEASGLGWELFSQYVRALDEVKPKFFLYENNKSMSKAIRDKIRETFGFEEIYINSSLVSAQNRQRYYWVGKRNEDGSYTRVNVELPNDLGITVKDILDGECNSKIVPLNLVNKEKAHTLRANYLHAGVSNFIESTNFDYSGVAEPVATSVVNQPFKRMKNEQGVYERRYEARVDGKSSSLVSTHAGQFGLVAEPISEYANPCKWTIDGLPLLAKSCADGKVYTVYVVKNNEITVGDKTYPIKLIDGYYIIRKFTISECKRLQTIPEWFEFPVSNTQAYKQLGNGWTCSVIKILINSVY